MDRSRIRVALPGVWRTVILVLAFHPHELGAAQQFAYVTNSGSNTVSAFVIDGTSGALTPVPNSPYAAGAEPLAAVVDPTNRFVYVANGLTNNISAYTIDSASGGLTAIVGSPFPAGIICHSIVVDPSGRFVYVANAGSNNISGFVINSTTGALAPVPNSPFPAGNSPHSVTVSPTGKFVLAGNLGGSVSVYTLDSVTGALAPIPESPFAMGAQPLFSISTDSAGKFVYMPTLRPSSSMWGFAITPSTGALTPVPGSPFPAASGTNWAAIHPSDRFLYVACDSDQVSAFAVDAATGTLTPIPGTPFPVASGGAPRGLAIDRTGTFVYVMNVLSNNISAFHINSADGSLTLIPGFPVASGGVDPTSMAITSATEASRNISVATNLSAATFTIMGPATYSGSGLTFTQPNAPLGTYTIAFSGPASYSTPPHQSLTLGDEGPISFYGAYQLRSGELTISSTLPGTTFTVNGPAAFSGLIGTTPLKYKLPIGAYTVSFAPAQGYVTPSPHSVSILEAASQAVSGTYILSPGTGTVVVTLNAPYVGFDMTGALGFSGVANKTFTNASPGQYHVQFLPSVSSGLSNPPVQDKVLFANQTLVFSAKYIPSTVPIKVVPAGTCNPIPSPLSFGGDVCIFFESKSGAPIGRLRGIIHIINATGAWYSVTIVRVPNSVGITDQQMPSVFLLPPRGANGFFDSSSDPSSYVEFGLGDSLILDLQRDSVEAAGAFCVDFLSRVFLGSDLPTFSSRGFLSLVDGGIIPTALGTIKAECANSFLSFLYGSTEPGTDWNDLGSTLTCIAKDDLAKGAFLRMLDQFVNIQQKNLLVGVMDKVGDLFSFASYLQHAVSAAEAFGGYYAAPAHAQIRLDGMSRGQ